MGLNLTSGKNVFFWISSGIMSYQMSLATWQHVKIGLARLIHKYLFRPCLFKLYKWMICYFCLQNYVVAIIIRFLFANIIIRNLGILSATFMSPLFRRLYGMISDLSLNLIPLTLKFCMKILSCLTTNKFHFGVFLQALEFGLIDGILETEY